MPFMAFLFLALAFSMAIATFIESSYGTSTARALVYNTHWFELLWALLSLNLINNLIKYKLLSKRKFALAIFHISFLVMVLGAAVTRYFSYEGVMHIRENKSSSSILSSDSYFLAESGNQQKKTKVRFSEFSPKQFSAKFDINGQEVDIKSVGFITNAERKIVPAENGEAVIDFVISTPGGGGMQTNMLKRGSWFNYSGFNVGFELQQKATINFFVENDELFFTSQTQVAATSMTGDGSGIFKPGETIRAKKMQLYSSGNYRFLVRNFYPGAVFTAVKSRNQTGEDAVLVEISEGESKRVGPVFGHSGVAAERVSVPLKNGDVKLAWGAFPRKLPFSIFLKDFQLEKYAGSNSPSSYASEVILQDETTGLKKEVRIFMNNTLSYKGYKFFQSSYDTDERGTVLSVNHDLWGTWITYLGYALLILGIALSLISKNSHFQQLAQKLKQTAVKTVIILFAVGGLVAGASAQTGAGASIPEIDSKIVNEFSRLWVQGADGRIEPVSTLTGEIVRKISRKSSLYGKSSDEVVLSMMTFPEIWRTLPIIKVSNKTLAEKLGATKKHISTDQLFDTQGNYKIAENVQAAYAKTPALRNRVEKEYIYVDERVNIVYMIFRGSLLNVFPRHDATAAWYSPGTAAHDFSGGDSIFVKNGFRLLLQSVAENRVPESVQVLQAVANFQQKFGGGLLPSDSKKNVEILYNKTNPFKRIFPFYLLFGFALLFILFVNIFRQKQLPGFLRFGFFWGIFLAFSIHTAGLIIRWYISGHAPWSNGYESVVYVAWASMLAGLIFGRKYPMVVGIAALLSGIALFVAHLSWMNPEVTNLVPVLKSYWLTIHVAVITASYGFIGLSAFLGILVLILVVLRKKSNEEKVSGFIEQLTTINEMSATVGLYFLTIGTFLGAIWANESWGRYWGWDPKETWSLITIVVYSFIVHMRLIPSLKGVFNFNVASLLGFTSVIMTYFGVNYYLTGLHSYGKGAANGINPAVPVVLVILVALIIWAFINNSKFEKETEK
jgi:cytochrome c-type biogenesis protein CcsB